MKRKILKSIFLSFAVITMAACSSDDANSGSNTDPITNPDPDPDPNPDPDPEPDPEVTFVHKVLIEDATGTWCQWCPRVSYAIEQAKANAANGKNVVAVAVHLGIQQYPDPMQLPTAGPLYNFYQSTGLQGFPYALINRTNKWTSPEPNNLAQVFSTISQEGSPIGIKISSDLNSTEGTISASFKFNKDYQDLKYSVFVIENDVVTSQSPQQNATSYYGGVRVDPNFVHQDVLRGFSGTITGNTLGNVTAGDEIVKDDQLVTYSLFNNDFSKVEVVVFVTDNSGKVLNVQIAHANESIDYEIIN